VRLPIPPLSHVLNDSLLGLPIAGKIVLSYPFELRLLACRAGDRASTRKKLAAKKRVMRWNRGAAAF
jgi:hypothetical protein